LNLGRADVLHTDYNTGSDRGKKLRVITCQ
jgi:hypothetical protein